MSDAGSCDVRHRAFQHCLLVLECLPMRGNWLVLLLSATLGCANSAEKNEAPRQTLSGVAATGPTTTTAPVAMRPVVAAIPAPQGAVRPYVLHLPRVSGTSIVDYTLRKGL